MSSERSVSRFAPSFHSLPRPLVTAIFLLVPVNTRLRCSEVSRAWRALLADTVFWERLDFAVWRGRFSEALFVAAVAKAGGQLRELDMSAGYIRLTFEALLNAVNANSLTLQRLRLHEGVDDLSFDLVVQLCEAAPAVRELRADVCCRAHEAHALLRHEPPFGALNIRSLTLQFTRAEDDEDFFLARIADLKLHGACLISRLSLMYMCFQAALCGMLWPTQPYPCTSSICLCRIPCFARRACPALRTYCATAASLRYGCMAHIIKHCLVPSSMLKQNPCYPPLCAPTQR